ncbi:MAG: hypothetical protein P4L31_04645 [Candidatus Babeliales bacterium]|nr:hypothetical protein [Candidatus Babeliales bacterium]
MKTSNLFFNLTLACFLLSTQAIHSSQKPQVEMSKQQKIAVIPKIGAVIGTLMLYATVHYDLFHITQNSRPSNPVANLNTVQTIERDCFSFSVPQNGGAFASDVYGPAYTDENRNILYAQDAIADIKAKYPQATIHYYDCQYFNHKPYNKE